MWQHRWARLFRRFPLALGASLLVAALLGVAVAQTASGEPIRIGVILPAMSGSAADSPFYEGVVEAARMGAIMAEEEFRRNAELLGVELAVVIARPAEEEMAREVAQRLVAEEGVFALIGGFSKEQALALSEFAQEQQLPFLNIASPSDALRNEACSLYTFHVAPSAAMYLDAIAGWFVRAGIRDWFFVYEDSEQGRGLYERILWALNERHFGAREVGNVAVPAEGQAWEDTLEAISEAEPDVVLLLLEPTDQLSFLEQYEGTGLEAQVTGFPYPAAQTRSFYSASREVAPVAGAGYRATAWEATLDSYGARELNARFMSRWDTPMEPTAWAAYMAVKILYETVLFGKVRGGPELVTYLESPQAVFDIWKGIGVTFRPWDHQLRQSLYLIKINPEAATAEELAVLVGELPALYMPRTEPVERLDQLGDLASTSQCSF